MCDRLPRRGQLVAGADALREAAGLEADRSVEINAADLALVIEPLEHDRYHAAVEQAIRTSGLHIAGLPVRFLAGTSGSGSGS